MLGVGIGSGRTGEFDPERFGEEGDARERARLLDDGLERLTAPTGRASSSRGPVQQPRIPVWVASVWPNRRPLRRAARWDGVFPIDMPGPEALPRCSMAEVERAARAGRRRVRGRRHEPAGHRPGPWIEAGATWCLTGFGSQPTRREVEEAIDARDPVVALRSVVATRYVEALREGGSLPGLMEADDDGLYVTKFRGAGQGEAALVAEVLAGELARALGLPVPELVVVVDVAPEVGHAEPDPEIQELLEASPGANLGMDFLPGALTFALPAEPSLDPAFAADVVWFDALVTNIDRTHRNPNLLVWHGRTWLIDHGAAFFRQHGDRPLAETADEPVPMLADHVLLPVAGPLGRGGRAARRARAGGGRGLCRARSRTTGSARSRTRRAPGCARSSSGGSRRRAASWRRRSVPAADLGQRPFSYALLRIVPHVERGERLNAGVVLFCREYDYLAVRTELDEARLERARARASTRPRCARTSRRSAAWRRATRAPERSRRSSPRSASAGSSRRPRR